MTGLLIHLVLPSNGNWHAVSLTVLLAAFYPQGKLASVWLPHNTQRQAQGNPE